MTPKTARQCASTQTSVLESTGLLRRVGIKGVGWWDLGVVGPSNDPASSTMPLTMTVTLVGYRTYHNT